MLIRIAWQNLWRNPLRSIVIILSMMTGLWAGAFIIGFFKGMINQQIETAISRQLSHIQIHHPKFGEEENILNTIKNGGNIALQLQQRKVVKAVSPRLLIAAMAATAHGSAGVTATGVSPGLEANVTSLGKYIAEGKYFDTTQTMSVIIGRRLQEKLQLRLNQKLILTFQNAGGEITAAAFRVAGVYTSNSSAIEESKLYVMAKDLAPLAGIQPGESHEIAILLHTNNEDEALAALLRNQYKDLRIETWKDLSPEMRLMIDSFNQYMYIIIGIILIALIFGIVNTMLMAVLERQRELGVLMAVGMNRSKIFFMVMCETIMLALAGCIVGLPLAWACITYFGKTGIDLSNWSQGLAMYGYDTMVYPSLDTIYYFEIGAMALAASVFAAIYPARKSLQLKPAEAIRKI